jgi:hypothetical protein
MKTRIVLSQDDIKAAISAYVAKEKGITTHAEKVKLKIIPADTDPRGLAPASVTAEAEEVEG